LRNSLIQTYKWKNLSGLLVAEAKSVGVQLDEHTPQVVAEMCATAVHTRYDPLCLSALLLTFGLHLCREDIVRGVLTNGFEWIFLILHLNKGGKGGKYMASPTVRIIMDHDITWKVLSPGPDIVAGILADWVCSALSFLSMHSLTNRGQLQNGFADLDKNDWFCYSE